MKNCPFTTAWVLIKSQRNDFTLPMWQSMSIRLTYFKFSSYSNVSKEVTYMCAVNLKKYLQGNKVPSHRGWWSHGNWKLQHGILPSVSTPTPILIYWQLPLPLKSSYGKEVVDGGIPCEGIWILNYPLSFTKELSLLFNVSLIIATDVATTTVFYFFHCHHHGPRLSLFHDRWGGHVMLGENTHTTKLHPFFLAHISFMAPFLWYTWALAMCRILF